MDIRVVRTLVYEGPAEWMEATLKACKLPLKGRVKFPSAGASITSSVTGIPQVVVNAVDVTQRRTGDGSSEGIRITRKG